MNYYPTDNHKKATEEILIFFSKYNYISSILLTCSCARGKASPESCVDIAVLLHPDIFNRNRPGLIEQWNIFYRNNKTIKEMLRYGKFAHVDIEFINGIFSPEDHYHGWMSGPDSFELEIGNYIYYRVPLRLNDDYDNHLRSTWLPYYRDSLRNERLNMVLKFCINNLEHIGSFVNRGLYFQAFDRFYNAYREFLQAVFIYYRKYPVCYEKWIKEQITDILKLPELYKEIVHLFEIKIFESQKMIENRDKLYSLIEKYTDNYKWRE